MKVFFCSLNVFSFLERGLFFGRPCLPPCLPSSVSPRQILDQRKDFVPRGQWKIDRYDMRFSEVAAPCVSCPSLSLSFSFSLFSFFQTVLSTQYARNMGEWPLFGSKTPNKVESVAAHTHIYTHTVPRENARDTQHFEQRVDPLERRSTERDNKTNKKGWS